MELAKKLRNDGWARPESDLDQPEWYEGSWNLTEKKSDCVIDEAVFIREAPCLIVSGPNTSGKSTREMKDLFLHLAFQATGFAPVKTGNLHTYDGYHYIVRDSTDAEENLSALMHDVSNIQKQLPFMTGHDKWFIDEGYSTAPTDQARLLFGTQKRITEHGGVIDVISHNDLLLNIAEQDPSMQVIHMETSVDKSGKLMRFFQTRSGRGESHAVEAAITSGYPQEMLEWVLAYKLGIIESPQQKKYPYPVIRAYTESDRNQLSEEIRSLEDMFQPKDEYLFEEFGSQTDFHPSQLLRHMHFDEGKIIRSGYDADTLKTLAARMILHTPKLTTQEVLERQRLFQELLAGEMYSKLSSAMQELVFMDDVVSIIHGSVQVGILKQLNPFMATVSRRVKKDGSRTIEYSDDALNAAIAYEQIVQKFSDGASENVRLVRLQLFKEIIASVYQREKDMLQKPSDVPLTEEETQAFQEIIRYMRRRKKISLADVHGAAVRIFTSSMKSAGRVPFVEYRDVSSVDISQELEALERYSSEVFGKWQVPDRSMEEPEFMFLHRELKNRGLPLAIQLLPDLKNKANVFAAQLRQTDSVHLHQMANYIESWTRHSIASIVGFDTGSKINKQPLYPRLRELNALCAFAGIIDFEGFRPAEFNSTGEVTLADSRSVFKDQAHTVPNTFYFDFRNLLSAFTGPNGSGKTFSNDEVLANILVSMASGYGLYGYVTLPVFDGLMHKPIVTRSTRKDLSLFAQELEYDKGIYNFLGTRKNVFGFIDEAGSTTSPVDQSAFAHALLMQFLKFHHYVLFSTNDHGLVDALLNAGIAGVAPYYFTFSIQDGMVIPHYEIREGHELSYAIEVARAMGFDEEILKAAEEIEV